jgi:DNA-binding SARP family transcriptional activator
MQSDQVLGFQSMLGPVPRDREHPVWLCLLGGVRLFSQGQPVLVRSGGKTEALLAHLGLAKAGYGVAREALLRAVWPDQEAPLAGQALNSLVHSLKGLLCGALAGATPVVQVSGYYRLNNEAGIDVDVAQFLALAAEGDRLERGADSAAAITPYERAVGLYAGDLSPAAGGGGQALIERERLRAMYLRLLLRLADASFAAGDYLACLAHAQRLLGHDPRREDAHRLVMRCHVRRGERAQALRQYQLARAILDDDFGVQPELATMALFEQVRFEPQAV